MFTKMLFRYMCLSILFMEGVNGLGLADSIELMKNGYQICGRHFEPLAVNKKCCYNKGNSKFFYEDRSICCNGEVHDKFDRFGKTRICCNDTVINGDKFICCKNLKHPIPKGYTRDQVGCCGNMTLTQGEMCCRGSNVTTKQIYSDGIGCCNGIRFNARVYWCQGTEILDHYHERCENKIIDLQTHSCCNDKVNDYPVYKRNNIGEKDEKRACCGESPYDSSTDTCCPNYKTIIPKDPEFACCGTGYFNITSEICCDENVSTRQYGQDSLCCGKEQINIAERACCYGQSYDKHTSKCCRGHSDGKVMSKNDLCCDGQDVTEDSVCCNSIKLIKKSDPSHDSCCLRNSQSGEMSFNSYNSIEKVCKDGDLLTKQTDGKEFCGVNPYDPTHDICCNNQLTPIIEGNRPACCGFTTIDENRQKCCKGYTIDFPTDEGICCFSEFGNGCLYNDESCSCTVKCNEKLYNPNSEICCGDKLYKKNDATECCGALPLYNNGNHTCCNGVRYNGSMECCGRRVLKDSDNCCGDFVVQKSKRKSQKCCRYVLHGTARSLPYDPRFSECNEQSGTVVSKRSKIPISPECRLSKVNKRNDIYGWIPAACNSRYGFLGTISNIESKRDQRTQRRYQMVTLTNVRQLKERKFGGKTLKFRGKTLKFRIEYKKSKPCFSRIKRLQNETVALFTSAIFENGYFDFVDHELYGNDIQYSNNEFYVVKVNRHFRHTFYNLKRSRFCDFNYHYRYTSLIR